MVKTIYEVGDSAWIAPANKDGSLNEGKVIAVLDLPGYDMKHYVIAIPTGIDDNLEIRCALTMAKDENSDLGLWESARENHAEWKKKQ